MADLIACFHALSQLCPRILCNEPMANHTTFRIGGKADLVAFPQSIQELTHILQWHKQNTPHMPMCILGRGSNVLFADERFSGLVIITTGLQNVTIASKNDDVYTVVADCGVSLTSLAQKCCKHIPPLSGLAFAYGIPGCIGGAIVMNAGAYGGDMSDVAVSVDYYDITSQTTHTLNKEALDFSYRHSIFQDHPDYIVLSATLELPVGNFDAIQAEMKKNMDARRQKQPLELPNAGSIFKRPEGAFVGKLVEDCGLKGYTVGGAQVSPKHAGFIVNTGDATAHDVLALIQHIQKVILETYGISLCCEIKYIQAP